MPGEAQDAAREMQLHSANQARVRRKFDDNVISHHALQTASPGRDRVLGQRRSAHDLERNAGRQIVREPLTLLRGQGEQMLLHALEPCLGSKVHRYFAEQAARDIAPQIRRHGTRLRQSGGTFRRHGLARVLEQLGGLGRGALALCGRTRIGLCASLLDDSIALRGHACPLRFNARERRICLLTGRTGLLELLLDLGTPRRRQFLHGLKEESMQQPHQSGEVHRLQRECPPVEAHFQPV